MSPGAADRRSRSRIHASVCTRTQSPDRARIRTGVSGARLPVRVPSGAGVPTSSDSRATTARSRADPAEALGVARSELVSIAAAADAVSVSVAAPRAASGIQPMRRTRAQAPSRLTSSSRNPESSRAITGPFAALRRFSPLEAVTDRLWPSRSVLPTDAPHIHPSRDTWTQPSRTTLPVTRTPAGTEARTRPCPPASWRKSS